MENEAYFAMFSSLLDEKLQPLNDRLSKLEEGQQAMNVRLGTLEDGQQVILGQLDNVSEQVVSNTEKLATVEKLALKVAEHDTDIS